MSWYSIFYWITVADGVRKFFDVASNLATWALGVSGALWFILLLVLKNDDTLSEADEKNIISSVKTAAKTTRVALWLALLLWIGYVFMPSKRDALTIVAGGAVGNFITKDTAAKQIPSEVMTLLRDKLRSEIKEIHITDQIKDSLASKTKEELIEMIKNKKP